MKVTKGFKTINFEQVNEFGQMGAVGFTSVYLWHCNKESKSDDELDIEVNAFILLKLVELDLRLGTTAAEQLLYFVLYTQRLDLIKV